MLNVSDVALYFIQKDINKELFNKNLITRNGRSFYEGNARLNKYLHLAQNIYIAKTGRQLMDVSFYAYDNGAVVPHIQENYPILLKKADNISDFNIDEEKADFLDRFYIAFQNSDIDELIQLSHEDPEWIDKHKHYAKKEQEMDSIKYIENMKVQYANIIKVMDRINV